MPHESTVDHDSQLSEDLPTPISLRSRSSESLEYSQTSKRARLVHQDSNLPNLRAEIPKKVTHTFDEDASDDESSSSTASENHRNIIDCAN